MQERLIYNSCVIHWGGEGGEDCNNKLINYYQVVPSKNCVLVEIIMHITYILQPYLICFTTRSIGQDKKVVIEHLLVLHFGMGLIKS